MNQVDHYAKIIWDYMHMHHELRPMDAVFGLGSYGTDIAERATDLYLQGYGKYLIFSGDSGVIHGSRAFHESPEAEVFADIARQRGVPEEKIIIENKSTNTQQNVEFTRTLLKERRLNLNSFLLVQKPYMERRTYATFRNFWPEAECIVTSPQISYEEYKKRQEEEGIDFIGGMVGDLERIKKYPARGFQILQEIPDNVWEAFLKLVAFGYTKRLLQ